MAQRAPKGSMKLQRPVSTEAVFNLLGCIGQPDCGMEGGMAQRAPKGSMKLQRPVSTEAVFNLLGCIGQPDCGDGGRDGAKGA